jgi:hypothetical protein
MLAIDRRGPAALNELRRLAGQLTGEGAKINIVAGTRYRRRNSSTHGISFLYLIQEEYAWTEP